MSDDELQAATMRLVATYADAVDEREFDRLREVFTESAVFTNPKSRRSGIDEIVAAMDGLLRYERTMHLVGLPHVRLGDDGHAAARTPCTAHHVADGTDHVMHLRYRDDLVRTDDGWRIQTRVLELLFAEEIPIS